MTTTTTLIDSTNLDDYRAAGGDINSIENDRILRRLVNREVLHCVSSLVSHFAQNEQALSGSDYTIDDVISLCSKYPDNSDAIEELQEKIDDLECQADGIDSDAEDCETTDEEHRLLAEAIALRDSATRLQAELDELESEQDDPVEALEHWAVTSWFAKRLANHGAITGEIFDFTIWGRTCSGQSISADGIIANIAAEMQILDGQKHSWKD